MSVDATRWAWSADVSSSTKKLILLSLADRAGEDHTCFPSVMRMVRDTKLNRKTVLTAISDLIDDGLVLDTGERKGNGVRVLKLVGVLGRESEDYPRKTTSPKIGTGTEIGTGTGTEIGTGTGTVFGTQNLKGNLKRNLTNNSHPIMEKALNENGADSQLISEWIAIRTKGKMTDSERSVNMFLKQVENSGHNINTVLNICVIKNWKGFEVGYLRNIDIADYVVEQNSKSPQADHQPVQQKEKIVKAKRSYI